MLLMSKKTDWLQVGAGGAIALFGLVEPTPLVEIVGLGIMADGFGLKLGDLL